MRRLFSFSVGVGLGATLAFLLVRGMRRARRRVPRAIAEEARSWLESTRHAWKEAMDEGRRAMSEREAELRLGAERPDR
jgi:hypothetical protein